MTPPAERSAPLAELAALAALLALITLRAIATFEPFPAWSDDPTQLPASVLGITPTISLALDAAILLASGLLAFLAARAGRPPSPILLLLFLAGAAGVALHALRLARGSPDDAVLGVTWTASLAGALALHASTRHPLHRRLAAAALLALLGMLLAKGINQYFVEQPRTLADYLANREAFLSAQGWSADSPLRRGFERRLSQREASGWFGFSNVFASLAAASLAALASLAWNARRSNPRLALAALLASLASLAAVILAGSKGGFGASLLGLGVVALAFSPRTRPLLRHAGLLAIFGTLAFVVLRGLVGERIHELSILFRWFYLQASTRIFAAYLPWGTGPSGFQDAYLLLKNPLSPEAIQSPHSVFFDWACTLGLAGLVWGALLLFLAFRVGPALVHQHNEIPAASERFTLRTEIRLLFLVAAAAMVPAAILELPTASIESAIVRFAGLAMWTGIAGIVLGVLRVAPTLASAALGAAAVALLAHGQIEMTPVNPGAAPAYFALLALAAAGAPRREPARGGAPWIAFGLSLPVAGVALVLPGVWRWESALRSAGDAVAPLPEITSRARTLAVAPNASEAFRIAREAAEELSGLLGRTVNPTPGDLERATRDLRLDRMRRALPLLQAAADAQPAHFPTSRALVTLSLQLVQEESGGGSAPTSVPIDGPERIAAQFASAHPGVSRAWSWLGTVRKAEARRDPEMGLLAIEAWEKAAARDPYSIPHPLELARMNAKLGRAEEASRWARRTLELDAGMRLDPIQGLNEAQRKELAALVRDR